MKSRASLAIENAALRQQLAAYARTSRRPRLHAGDRVFWVMLRRPWPDWTRALVDALSTSTSLRIPFGAPNASPHVERFMRTLREEALDHFIFLSADHVRRVTHEYVRYYNGALPSQAIHAIPAPYPELRQPPPRSGRLVALPVLGDIQHDYRLVA